VAQKSVRLCTEHDFVKAAGFSLARFLSRTLRSSAVSLSRACSANCQRATASDARCLQSFAKAHAVVALPMQHVCDKSAHRLFAVAERSAACTNFRLMYPVSDLV